MDREKGEREIRMRWGVKCHCILGSGGIEEYPDFLSMIFNSLCLLVCKELIPIIVYKKTALKSYRANILFIFTSYKSTPELKKTHKSPDPQSHEIS